MGQEKSTMLLLNQLLILLSLLSGAYACPYLCTCAGFKVNCYGKGLTEIPDNFPPDVVSIDLQYNEIETIGDQFHNLTSLTEVMLRFNRISHLDNDAFSDLPDLSHINLGSNLIANLSGGVFRNVPKMSILDLTDNRLSSVDDSFQGLSSLTKLVLTRNAIEELTENSLKPLTKLIYFMADENLISVVHPDAFRSLKELSFLSLIHNPLTSMDEVLSENAMLSYLNLDDCRLTRVPAGLPWATRNLQLRRNNITSVSRDAFRGTQYLGIVMLDDNQISHLDPDTFTPIAHIQEVWLNGNHLTALPTPIPPTLHILSVDGNNITRVSHEDFPHDCQLKVLSLTGNGIGSIAPFTFSRLASLEKLYLADNAIAELKDRSFFGMRNLTLLEVGHNPIAHIEVRFAASLHKLDVLNLSFVDDSEPLMGGNFFRDIPFMKTLLLRSSPALARNILTSNETLKSFYNLEKLDIRDNALQGFDVDLPRFFPKLQQAWLAGNAWLCDPSLLWLHDWMQNSRNVFLDLDHVTCAVPDHLAGSVIADLPYHAFFYTTTVPTTLMMSTDDVVASGDMDGYETDSGEAGKLTTDSPSANVTTGVAGSSPTSGPAKSLTTVGVFTTRKDKEAVPDAVSTTKDMGKHRTDSAVTEKTKLKDTTTSNIKTTTTSLNNNDNNNSGAKTSRVKGQTTTTTTKFTTTTSTTTTSKLGKTTKRSAATSTKPPQTTSSKTKTTTTTTTREPRHTTKTLPPSSTTTTTTATTPAPTDIPRHGESKIDSSSSASSSTTTIIIAACVAGVALIVIIVIALVVILRHKRHIRLVMYRALTSDTQTGGDTELVLNDQDDPATDTGHMTQLSESEQGSTPSVEVASDDGLCTRLV